MVGVYMHMHPGTVKVKGFLSQKSNDEREESSNGIEQNDVERMRSLRLCHPEFCDIIHFWTTKVRSQNKLKYKEK